MYPRKNSDFGIFVKRQVEQLEKDGVKIMKVVRTGKTHFAYLPFFSKSVFYLLFRTYDLVHGHYGFHSALFPAVIKRKPLVVTFHGSDALKEPLRHKVYRNLQKFVISRCDNIIAVSNEIKNVLTSNLGADPNEISIISCGVDTSVFLPLEKMDVRRKLGIAENAKIVLFVGSLSYGKGVDVIFECARRMPDVLFILVGDGSLKTDIGNCKFPGACPHEEMPKWMNAADIFVLPSRSEGTPVVILEALSCGIPVIASRIGGCPDVIKDGQTGYLIPVNHVDMLQRKVRDLLNDDVGRNLMGKQGRKDMIEKFDIKKIAQRIKQIYEQTRSPRGSV